MHVKNQLRLIIISFIGLTVFLVGMGFTLFRGVETMKTAESWTAHTNRVKTAIDKARTAYAEAESLGRLAIVDASHRPRVPSVRDEAIRELNLVRELERDNSQQSESLRNLENLIKQRFAVQDRQAQAVRSDGNGAIISDVNLTIESIETQNKVIASFSQIKADEDILLWQRFDRLSASQWRIVWIFTTLIVLSFLFCSAAFYLTYAALTGRLYVGEKLSGLLSESNGDKFVQVEVSEIKRLKNLIEETGLEKINA